MANTLLQDLMAEGSKSSGSLPPIKVGRSQSQTTEIIGGSKTTIENNIQAYGPYSSAVKQNDTTNGAINLAPLST